jgi:hypothetical protein
VRVIHSARSLGLAHLLFCMLGEEDKATS